MKYLLMICLSLISLSVQAASLQCTKPVTFFDARFKQIKKPVVVSNDNGDAAITWMAFQEGDQEGTFHIASKTTDTPWSTVQSLQAGTKPKKIKIVMDEVGKISFCWELNDDKRLYLYFGQKTPDEFWVTPFNVVHNLDLKRDIHLLPSGKVVIVGSNADCFGKLIETDKFVKEKFIALGSSEKSLFLNSKGEGLAFEKHPWDWKNESSTLTSSWWGEGDGMSPAQTLGFVSSYGIYDVHGIRSENPTEMGGAIYWRNYPTFNIVTFTNGQWSPIGDFVLQDLIYDTKIAMNFQNDVLFLWESDREINAAYKPKGQSWIHSNLVLHNKDYFNIKDIKSDPSGNFILIWEGQIKCVKNLGTEMRDAIYAAVFSIQEQTWSDPVLLSPQALSCSSPSLTLTKPGHGFVSWVASNGFDTGVQVTELTYITQ